MDKQNNENSKSKKIIIILIILLILSLLGLLARYLYLNNFQKDNAVTVPNNIINEIEDVADQGMDNNDNEEVNNNSSKSEGGNIGENVDQDTDKKPSDNTINDDNSNNSSDNGHESGSDKNEIEAPKIELDKQNPSDNERFDVSNMLPGDSVTKYFCVKTTHDFDVKVYFESTVVEQTKNLGDVLDIKVFDVTDGVDKEKIVAQGTFNEIDKKSYPVQLKKNKNGNTVQYYKIVVSLDTSVGNPYQAAKLSANFKWYVTDEEVKALSKDKPIIPGITKPNNSDNNGETTKTGDIFDKSLWVIFIGSALMIILLSVKNRSRKEDE